eukprot:g17602.t1
MVTGVWAAGGALALAWLPALARAQEEGEGDVAVEEGGGEPDKNSSVAKEVERWLPLALGLVLAVAVIGWCTLNVLRASKRQGEDATAEELEYKTGSKLSDNTQSRQASSRMPSYAISGERGGVGTGDVSPEVDGTLQVKRSLRASSVGGQHGAFRGVKADALLPQMIFEGDELQGKKAPGEQGNVYRNPMQRSGLAEVSVSTPETSDATTRSSGNISGRFLSASRAGKSGLSATTGTMKGGNKSRAKGGGFSGSSGNDDDDDSPFDMMELGATTRGRGTGGGGGGSGGGSDHQRRPTTNLSATHQQPTRRGSGRGTGGRRGSGGSRSSRSKSVEETESFSTSEDGDRQSNLSRTLRPAVLRAARPIPHNSGSGGALTDSYERNTATAVAAGALPASSSRRGGEGRRR